MNGQLITIVAADREADSGPGWAPYYEADPNIRAQLDCQEDGICYVPVTVDDNYADAHYGYHATHIVGIGIIQRINPDNPPPSTNVNRVYVGWGRCTTQLDKFISFNSDNGGGVEIKLCRISGYLMFQNQQVTNFAGDQGLAKFKRKEIRKGIWKRIYWTWDPDWVVGNTEQVMAICEEDDESTQTFTGSLGTTLRLDSTTTITGNIGYSVQVKSQDALVLQRKISRTAYFGAAKTEQGWGSNLCDKNGTTCRYDNTFLSTGNWPAYDGNGSSGATWNYTWPYNSY